MIRSKRNYVGPLFAWIVAYSLPGLAVAHPGHGVLEAAHPLHSVLDPLHLALWLSVATAAALAGYGLLRRRPAVVRISRKSAS